MKKLLSIALCLVLTLGALVVPVKAAATCTVQIFQPTVLQYKELDTIEFEATITGGTEDEPAYFANHAIYIGRDLGHMTNSGPEVEVISFEERSEGTSAIPTGEKITVRAKLGKTQLDRTGPYDAYIVIEYEDFDSVGRQAFSTFKLRITPEGWTAPSINASTWATAYIEKAMNYGIIPASIIDDFTKPITREEFAELAVRLYEVNTGLTADPAPDSTFSDCYNPEVLKAFKLGIVSGVGGGKFDPKALTNREQIAAMLYRAVKAIAPTTDFSTVGAPTFSDASKVSSYFVDNVKYMSKHNFITGFSGKFDPKGTCTREMAVIIAVKVFEAF